MASFPAFRPHGFALFLAPSEDRKKGRPGFPDRLAASTLLPERKRQGCMNGQWRFPARRETFTFSMEWRHDKSRGRLNDFKGSVMACGCFISTVSNPRLRPSPAAKGEARRGKRHMPMKESGGTGPRSLMRPPPCRASKATAAQGRTAGCGKRPGAGYDEPPRMGLPAGCGKTWPCHGM